MSFMHTRNVILWIALSLSVFASYAYAEERTYTLSYSPGTLFHQLVRDRAKLAYEKAGIPATFISLPHNRSLMSANDGTVDGDVGRVPSVEKKYSNLVRVNAKLMDLNGAVYTNNPDIKEYDEGLLSSYRVGYVLGVRWTENKLKGTDATAARDYPSLFKMLVEDRIDIALATEASADAVLNDLPESRNIRKLQPFVFSSPIYHYVNKKNADIVPKLEVAIKAINEAGIVVFYTGAKSPILEILRGRLQEAFNRIGKTCEVRYVGSAERSLMLANEQGDGDASRIAKIINLSPELTSNLIVIPEPVLNIDFYVFTTGRKFDSLQWSSLSELRNGFRVGTKVLEQNIPGIRTMLPDSERLFKMLSENRLDTVIEHADIADYLIKKLHLKNIHQSATPLVALPGHPLIQKKYQELIPDIAASLAEMKKDGSYEEIKEIAIRKLLSQDRQK